MGLILIAGLLALAPPQERKPNETIAIPGTDLKFEMVYVPGGRAKLGSPPNEAGRKADEMALHEIELRPFWMSKTEVTWECFVKYFENRRTSKLDGVTRPSPPYEPPHGTMGTGAHPAVGMRWHGAMGYAEWVSTLTGQRFRLPTEAEWEYAARAGSTAAGPEKAQDGAWIKENGGSRNHLVGTKNPNALGLCDLMGNVWEYALEFHTGPEYRPVLRGGAWTTAAAELRYAARQEIQPLWYDRDPNRPRSMWWLTDGTFIGFRLVRFADPAEKKDQAAYFPKIDISDVKPGAAANGNARVTGRIRNGGDRSLDEVELTVYYLDDDGKPLFEDGKARPCFSKVYPALLNSDQPGDHRAPLKPGEMRTFVLDVPQPFETDSELTKVGAKVSALQFSRP